jgi:phosphoserine phosphatase
MRIGIDFHGTIDAHPDYFAAVMRELRDAGHEVGVVTAAPQLSTGEILRRVRALGLPDPDFVIAKTGVEQAIPNIAWKHLVMRRDRIDYLFDDFDTGEVRLVGRC